MSRRPVAYKKPSLVARLVDRAVAVVSPERGLRRIQARSALGLVQASIGSVTNSGRGGSPKRGAAAKEGTLRNWNPNRINAALEARQREDVVYRALDLEANDPHVNGLVESMSINTVGSGFTAQSRIRADQLTLSEDKITELQKQMEWNWAVWSKEADVREKDHFNDLLAVADRSMLVRGEYLIIPQLVKRPHRTFSFALRAVDPLRLKTPTDLIKREDIIDGIEVDGDGFPKAYWVRRGNAKPTDGSSKSFVRIPAYNGHRKNVFHGYITKDPEQWRGYVFFAPAMKFFRDLSDHLDAELVSNIVTSAAALFIASPEPSAAVVAAMGGDVASLYSNELYEEVIPGQTIYGAPGQKPEVLEHNRPGNNFVPFVDTILRAASTCAGIPYEVAAKRYGEMNYSSARAALLDAWRVFGFRQSHLMRHLCQPCWEAVQEEAYLNNLLDMPEFYLRRHAYLKTEWLPQARGYVDPVKEVQSDILRLKYKLPGGTYAAIGAAQGRDWEADMEQHAKERQLLIDKELKDDLPTSKTAGKENAK